MYVGFDIGGTSIKYGLVAENGAITKKNSIGTKEDKEDIITDLVKIIKEYQISDAGILGVGISAPGIIKDGLMVTAGSIKSLYGTDLKKELEAQTGLPVVIENDGNAATIAERWLGNAKGVDNYLCLVLGTGLGAGMVLNGDVYRGQHGMAGEVGWMVIDALPPEDNIEFVSLNWRGSVIMGLCRQYNEAMQAVDPAFEEVADARVIFSARDAGEEIATRVLRQYLVDLSVMLINLVAIFDPERILIGGGISANTAFMDELQMTFAEVLGRHESLAALDKGMIAKIMPAGLRNDAGMIGAVYQLRRQLEK